MPLFSYSALDQKGKKTVGQIEAKSEKLGRSLLVKQNLLPISIKEIQEKKGKKKQTKKKPFISLKSVSLVQLTNFTRDFGIMLDSGIPYDKALDLSLRGANGYFRTVLTAIKDQVIEGSLLAKAFANYPKVFSKMFIAMISSGETTGNLGASMLNFATFLEQKQKLTSKIQAALIYPIILSLLGIAIVVFMIQFILPKITPIFLSFGAELPLVTRILIQVSDITINYGVEILFSLAGILLLFRIMTARGPGERILHIFLLKNLVSRKMMNLLLSYRFMQTLGSLLIAGVELRQALSIVKESTGNRIFQERVEVMLEDVSTKGMLISQAIQKSNLLSPQIVQMILIGEESGKLSLMLDKITKNLEIELQNYLDKVISLLEPIVILIMAFFVGFIVMAIVFPLFEMNQLIR